jgi:hypothetical protein
MDVICRVLRTSLPPRKTIENWQRDLYSFVLRMLAYNVLRRAKADTTMRRSGSHGSLNARRLIIAEDLWLV